MLLWGNNIHPYHNVHLDESSIVIFVMLLTTISDQDHSGVMYKLLHLFLIQ